MRLHARSFGEGPPVVLLHGFTGSGETWMPYVDDLAGFRVVAIDLPGHGRSPAPGAGTSFEAVADAVVSVLDRYELESAAWVGYSMGGRVALQVAAAHPGRMDRLVVESASPGLRGVDERAARVEADDALADRIVDGGLEAFVERWAAQPLFASQKRLSASILERERTARLANSAAGIAGGLRVMSVGRQPSLWSALPSMELPLLFLVGADDGKYCDIARSAVEAAARARLVVVEEAGHTVHLERPDAFWPEVRAFLQGEDS